MIFKNLWRRKTRSFLTILGIAIGVAAVVGLGAMAQGMMKNYGSVVGLSNDLLVSQANAFDVAFSSLDAELEQRLLAVPGVEEVDPGVYGWIVTEEMPYFLVFGYHPGSIAMGHYRIVEGKPVTGPKQIALGRRAADSLKKKIDDTLRIYGVPYQIVGIYETGQALEESGGTVALEDAQTITQKIRKVSLFQVGVRRGTDLDQVIQRLEALENDLTVSKSSEYQASQDWSQYLQGFAWGVAAIAILIGGLGMMNAMVMSVLERTREIGTLRAVGWSRNRVVALILGETVALSLLGGLVGIGMGVGFTELAARAPGIGGMLEGAYSAGIFVQGLVTALGLGVVGGAYPAWVAANLQPVEALRYEGGGTGEVKGRLARVGNQSFRNLWRRRTRTIISVTGIGIGVATLVMLGGLIEGISGELNSLAGSSGAGNVTIMQRDVADMSMSSLDERTVSLIRSMPQVASVSPMLLGFIVSGDMPFFLISGLDPNCAAMTHYKIVEGRYILRPNEVVLGKTAAKTYKLDVGDTLTLFENRYKIVGIIETGVAWEEGGGILALREAQRLLNRPRSVSYIFVDVKNPAQAAAVRDAINRHFPEARASLSSEFAQSTDDMANARAMFGAIGFLALLVGGIVVANTLLMSVYERTREIGTLRALGWRKRRILSQIVQESLLLCALSAVIGSLMGVLLLVLIAHAPVANAFISARWNAGIFAQAISVTLIVGLVAGIYPAWRASRLQPVEALRYEFRTTDLIKVYGSGEHGVRALDGVNLKVLPGELVAVMGPSGCGKSTLLNMLGALDQPTEGEVRVAGENLAKLKNVDAFRAQTVGFVFQLHNLLPTLTALENVEVPMQGQVSSHRERQERAAHLLEVAGLGDRPDALPGQLSGGQRQRVAVARALANDPALILADEPTGSLDRQSGEEILQLLADLNRNQGTTILIVTHNHRVAQITQRILRMHDGRIVSDHRLTDPLEEDLRTLAYSRLGQAILGDNGLLPGYLLREEEATLRRLLVKVSAAEGQTREE